MHNDMAEQRALTASAHRMNDRPPPRSRRHVSKDVWLLLGMILLALGWFVRLSRLAMNQHAAVESIRKSGGQTYYDWEWSDGRPVPGARAPWLSEFMISSPSAPDHSANVVCVSFAGTHGADIEMTIVRQFLTLEELNLSGTSLTDDQTVHFQSLTRLRRLDLSSTKVTGASLANLKNLAQLQALDLTSTAVADSDLTYLKELWQLRYLKLSQTDITDAGLSRLRDLSNLERLDLSECGKNITDAGLISLGGLLQLESLILDDTDVTDAGLPNLSGLVRLQSLSLRNTRTSNAGVNSFRSQRPEVKIVR